MKGDRPWYREPETFIAVAALVVSVSAVAVGLYEAQLQRAHDRADVWPHVEISTFVTPKGASLFVENTGLGPAIIKSVVVTVDGKPRRSWDDVLRALGDSARGDEHDDRGRSCPPRWRTNGARGARSTGPAAPLLGVGRARCGHHLLFVRLQRELGCERRPSGRYEYVAVGGSVPEPGERRGFLSERRVYPPRKRLFVGSTPTGASQQDNDSRDLVSGVGNVPGNITLASVWREGR